MATQYPQVPNPFVDPSGFSNARSGTPPVVSTPAASSQPGLSTGSSSRGTFVATPNPFVNPQGFWAAKTGQPPLTPPAIEVAQTAVAPAEPLNVSNPFFDPSTFQQVKDMKVGRPMVETPASPDRSRTKDTPNPFVYPHDFEVQRRLTVQMAYSVTTPEQQAELATAPAQIQDAATAPASADPLLDRVKPEQPSAGNPFFDPAHFLSFRTKANAEWVALMEAVNDISVVEVIMELGGVGNQDGDPNKYKLRGDNIQVNGQQWYNFNADEGSGGPASLVQAFENIDRKDDAIRWLANRFKDRIGTDAIRAAARSGDVKEKPKFEPPENAPQFLDAVRNYLHKERGISRELIERLIGDGRLYADPHKNVVMISKTGQLAELRGTEPYQDRKTGEWKSTKMLKPGSDKSSGAFMVPPDKAKIKDKTLVAEKAFGVVEAGIDAMSYHMLFPGRAVTSASGASFTYPRRLLFDAIQNGYAFHCGFDADQAGDKASQNIYNSALLFDHFRTHHGIQTTGDFIGLFNRKILRLKLRPELHRHESTMEEDDDVMDEGLADNVLFFNSDNPFENAQRPPVVRYQVKQNNLGIKSGNFEIKVTPELHARILQEFKLHRDRPTNAKDWNEMVKPKTNNMPKFS